MVRQSHACVHVWLCVHVWVFDLFMCILLLEQIRVDNSEVLLEQIFFRIDPELMVSFGIFVVPRDNHTHTYIHTYIHACIHTSATRVFS